MNDNYIEVNNSLITLDSSTYISPIVEEYIKVFFTIEYKSGFATKIDNLIIESHITSFTFWCEQTNNCLTEIKEIKRGYRDVTQKQLLSRIKNSHPKIYKEYRTFYEKSYTDAQQEIITKRALNAEKYKQIDQIKKEVQSLQIKLTEVYTARQKLNGIFIQKYRSEMESLENEISALEKVLKNENK